jgi:hypothetical protein
LSFPELYTDQISLTFVEYLAPFDFAGKKEDAWEA